MKFLQIVVFFFVFAGSITGKAQSNNEIYLFSYFVDNGEDGLHLAYSTDGYKWEALNGNKPVLTPSVGVDKLMRDPCVISGPDGKFHIVWTVSWGEKGIGYASSEDLIHWSEQKYLPVMEHEKGALNCWAPEVFYDEASKQFVIFWSTTIPGRFPGTEKTGDSDYNHRMYYVTTRDFATFSETKLFYNHGFNVIDGTLTKNGDEYVLFLKNETRYPPEKNIRMATGKTFSDNFDPASDPITGDYWAEGPTSVKIGDFVVVYFDKYMEHKMGAVRSSDRKNWEDISEQIKFPEGTRHGTVLEVSKSVLEKLKLLNN